MLDRIGQGGMGVVYAAYDSDLDRKVALKFLHADRSGDSVPETRLMREAQAMARLSHPNVIAVYEVGGFEEQIFLAMEFVEGMDLRRWLEAEERTPADIIAVFRAAGQGLAAAHAAGLVHRDFKPSNVLVDKQNRPRVTDFGISRAARRAGGEAGEVKAEPEERDQPERQGASLLTAELTRTGEVHGTPRYMAPEQHRSGDADERSDQFAFCVALYEALYRRHPFRGRDLAELVDNALTGRVHRPPPQPSVPRSCRSAILRGLRALPEERFPSMDALLAALESSRPRGRLALALAGVLLAGLVAVGLAIEQDPGEERCTGGRAQAASVWDAAASTRIASAFAASGKPYARSSAARVAERLDDYTGRWAAMHRATCQATWRGEQSPELLDRRMACLDRRLGQVGVLVELLRRPDGDVVDKSIDLVAALEPLSVCADSAMLLSRPAGPADTQLRARLAERERQVDRAELERQAGRPQAAADAVRGLVEADRPGDDPHLAARAGRVLGRALEDLGRPAEARESLLQAHGLATRAGDLRLATHIRIDLLRVVGARQMRAGEAELLERITGADLDRPELRDDPDTRALLLAALARIAVEERRGPRAVELQREVLAIRRASSPRFSEEVASAEETLGLALGEAGEQEEARSHYREALAIRRHLVGDEHPLTANVLINLGVSYLDDANTVEARKHLLAALAILERMPEYRTYPTVLSNLGALEGQDANHEQARRYHEAALAVNLRAVGPSHMSVARALGSIAITLREAGDLEQALDHHRRALAIYEKNGSTDQVDYARALASLGEDLRQLGRPAESLRNQERALEIIRARSASRMSSILLFKGLALLDLGRHRDAIEPLEQAREGFGDTGLAGARVAFGLARALEPGRPRSPRATQLAEMALEIFTEKRHSRERDEVAAYLARGRAR